MRTLVALVLIVGTTSCSMEKRVYSSGFHLEWNLTRKAANNTEITNMENGKQKII